MLLSLENGRLDAELRTMAAELAASQARIAAAGDAERRRVERDLHDGAQQQLVALQIKVALARELAASDSEVAARLTDVGYGLEDVLSELRELAHGAAPRCCGSPGCAPALASAAQRSRRPRRSSPTASPATRRRSRPRSTSAAWKRCRTCASTPGAGARAEVRVSERARELCFEVVDDGVGCEIEPARGAGVGLTNMSERVSALRGTLNVESVAGRGTTVRGRIPLAVQGRSARSADRPIRVMPGRRWRRLRRGMLSARRRAVVWS